MVGGCRGDKEEGEKEREERKGREKGRGKRNRMGSLWGQEIEIRSRSRCRSARRRAMITSTISR